MFGILKRSEDLLTVTFLTFKMNLTWLQNTHTHHVPLLFLSYQRQMGEHLCKCVTILLRIWSSSRSDHSLLRCLNAASLQHESLSWRPSFSPATNKRRPTARKWITWQQLCVRASLGRALNPLHVFRGSMGHSARADIQSHADPTRRSYTPFK